MSRSQNDRSDPPALLEASRARFERSVESLRGALESEFGTAPKFGRFALLIAAAAAGFVAGQTIGGGRRSRRG